MNAIETSGLTRRFGRTYAVRDLDLTVPAGSVNVLVGANGAGKTTTLKLLLDLLPPTAGTARVLGTDSTRLGPAEMRRIGCVSESMRQPEGLTVDGLLAAWRPLYPRWDHDLEARLRRDFDLPGNRKLSALSRGMAMKAALLSVLPYHPELLILDEPFSGLDVLTRDQLVQGMLELVAQDGCTVLVSSHEVAEVESLAERVLWMDTGRLRLAEDAESLRARFRRVVAPTGSDPLPGSAWDVVREGRITRYIDSAFDPALTPADAEAAPLSLREILVALLRNRAGTTVSSP